jgi:integrase
MPRRSSIRYFASRGAYYCQIDRRQYQLAKGPDDAPRGPTYLAALETFRRLLEAENVEVAGNANTVRTICDQFLHATSQQVESSTQKRRIELLTPFVIALGNVRVSELNAFKIDAFVNDMRRPRRSDRPRKLGGPRVCQWGDSTVTHFLTKASAAFQWAVDRKLISENPFKGIKKPGIRSRGRDCLITPEQHQLFLRLTPHSGMHRVLIALENTGARPGELAAAEARYWDEERHALVYHADVRRRHGEFRSKAAAHKDRIIYFTGAALELMQQLIRQYPTGKLFRTRKGRPFDVRGIQSFFRHFRRRKAVQMPGLTAYSYRHTFATNWLKESRSIELLAELLGNTPAIIRKHYAHLCGDWRTLRRHLEDFTRSPGNTSADAAGRPAAEPPPARPLVE